MIDHSAMKLGRHHVRIDSRTLRLAKYLPKELPPPPEDKDWSHGITDWGMMLNDALGDCTIAACGHAVQVWTVNTTIEVTLGDGIIQKAYQDWDGYNPADPSTDQGGVEIDVLNNWRRNGLGGYKISAYVGLDEKNLEHVKQAIAIFGGLYIGLALPLTAQKQNIWDVVRPSWWKRLFGGGGGGNSAPNSWGGHAVWVVGYNKIGPVCITWGALKQMTWTFWLKYCDESYALLSNDWTVAGIDSATLQEDLQLVAA